MIRVRLTPATVGAGDTRIFEVVSTAYNSRTRQLTLTLRDGSMCVELQGEWEMHTAPSQLVPHTIAEAERIHDGRALVLLAAH